MSFRKHLLCLAAAVLILAPLAITVDAAPRVQGEVTLVDRDEQRRSLSDVLVSDGFSFTRSDAQGRYELELHDEARMVMIVNPRGTQPTEALYELLPSEESEADASEAASDTARDLPESIDFELQASTHVAGEPFRFVHVSDIHIGNEYSGDRRRAATVEAVNRLPDPPAFIADTGDVSLDTVERLEITAEALAGFEMPHLPANGNHDRPRAAEFRGATFERLFAPMYYAYTHGDYLFLALPWAEKVDDAYEWSEALLEELRDEFHLVPYFHHWDGFGDRYDDFLELFQAHDARGVLVGHYHIMQILQAEGMPVFNVGAGNSYTRDLGLPSFNVVTAHPDGELEVDRRITRQHQRLELVAPAADAGLIAGHREPLLVSAVDTAYDVAEVEVSVYEAQATGRRLARVALERNGGWAWAGALSVNEQWPGKVRLVVRARDEEGREWPTVDRFIPVRHDMAAVDAPAPRIELGGEWPMLDGNPQRTRHVDESVTPPLRLAWVHADRSFGLSSPIVSDGRVFAGLDNNVSATRAQPSVVALDAVTGDLAWLAELTGRSVRNTLASDGRTLFLQADDGLIQALDWDSGDVRWTAEHMVSQPRRAQIYHSSSPLIVEGTAVTGAGQLYSRLALDDGDRLWDRIEGRGTRGWVPAAPTLGEERVFVNEGRNLRAVDLSSGSTRWERSFAGSLLATPAYADGRLIHLAPGPDRWDISLVALDPETGETQWENVLKHRGMFFNSPAVGDGRAYVADFDELVAVDVANGRVLWRLDLEPLLSEYDYFMAEKLESAALYPDTDYSMITSSLVLAGDFLYVITRTGQLAAIDVREPAIVWRYDLGTYVDSTPAVSGNALFITGRNGALYAFVEDEGASR